MVIARGTCAMILVGWLSGACGNKARPAADDAVRGPHAEDGAKGSAAAADAAAAPDADPDVAPDTAAIHVRWTDLPTSWRRSPGPTPCHTPRAPAVEPTTLWGIPDALVTLDGAREVPAEARVTLADCVLSPRLVVGRTLVVESTLDRPVRLALEKHGDVASLDKLHAEKPRAIQIPIAGHAVEVALDAGGVYRLAVENQAAIEPAWIVAAPAAVTDDSGMAELAAPAGKHAVVAWLPARAGQSARQVAGTVTIEADRGVEHTLELAPSKSSKPTP